MMLRTLLLAAALTAAAQHASAAFSGDLQPRLAGNTIIIDGVSEDDGSTSPNIPAFQYPLGELTHGYASDPGIKPTTASGLPGNSFLGFNILGPLLHWNGTGSPAFSPASANTSFQLYLGAQNVSITGASAPQNGFVVQKLTAAGAGHIHLNAQLLGPASPTGTYTDPLGNTFNPPPDGVCAFPIELTVDPSQTTAPAQYRSAPTWLVYGQNVSDQQLALAADALAPIPESASLSLLALAIPFLLRRR